MKYHILTVMVAALLASACGGDTPGLGTLEDMEFLAFVPEEDGACCAAEPRPLRLSDYYAESRPGTKILMINAAAGWCGPCMREASALPAFAAVYEPRGVMILSAVFQDQNGAPADSEFTRTWAETFALTTPTLIDTSFQMGKYFDAGTMPANLFVDAETREILKISAGAETGDDPLAEYRDLLDYYLR